MPCALRLRLIELRSEARMPVTTMSPLASVPSVVAVLCVVVVLVG